MAVSEPNLTIVLSKNDACTEFNLTDTTGQYDGVTNFTGYGLPGGPACPSDGSSTDIQTLEVILTYNSAGTSITYSFELTDSIEITAATLAIEAGTPVDILDQLPSTVWPFVLPFNLVGDYGVIIPTFQDDIYSVSYTISGEVSAEAFEFTTIENKEIVCATECCKNKKFVEIDWNCDCATDKSKEANLLQTYLYQIPAAISLGDLSSAVTALNQAKWLCDSSIGGCGCS